MPAHYFYLSPSSPSLALPASLLPSSRTLTYHMCPHAVPSVSDFARPLNRAYACSLAGLVVVAAAAVEAVVVVALCVCV